MKRALTIALFPPVAACKYGCAGCCAAPIAVFWLAGIAAMIYGLLGGPANLMGPSWNTAALGLLLWLIAAVWSAVSIRGADEETCTQRDSNPLCKTLAPGKAGTAADESDPFDEVRKAR